jgi:hypothetical protein
VAGVVSNHDGKALASALFLKVGAEALSEKRIQRGVVSERHKGGGPCEMIHEKRQGGTGTAAASMRGNVRRRQHGGKELETQTKELDLTLEGDRG